MQIYKKKYLLLVCLAFLLYKEPSNFKAVVLVVVALGVYNLG